LPGAYVHHGGEHDQGGNHGKRIHQITGACFAMRLAATAPARLGRRADSPMHGRLAAVLSHIGDTRYWSLYYAVHQEPS
jgi:hypothetical protein